MKKPTLIWMSYILHLAGAQLESPPRILIEPPSRVVWKDKAVTLPCKSENGVVKWFRNGKLVDVNDGFETLSDGSLVIAEREFAVGDYYCQVSNPQVGVMRSRKTRVLKAVYPGLIHTPANISVYEENAAYFACLPNASIPLSSNDLLNESYGNAIQPINNGEQAVVWFRYGHSIQTDSDEFLYLPNGGLFIPDVSLTLSNNNQRETDEAGVPDQYCCVAFNHPPVCASLTILPIDGINATLTLAVEPYNLTLQVGQTGVVPCIGAGVPAPTVTWYKQVGQKITSGHEDIEASAVLIIKHSTVRDSGIYRCVVKNVNGWIDRNISVVVSDVPKVNYTFDGSIWVHRNEQARLVCPVMKTRYPPSVDSFIPSVHIMWLFNGSKISTHSNRQMVLSKDTLVVNSVKLVDEGLYQCVVENAYGSAQTTFRLRSCEAPSKVSEISASVVPGNVIVSWRSPSYAGCQYSSCNIDEYRVQSSRWPLGHVSSFFTTSETKVALFDEKGKQKVLGLSVVLPSLGENYVFTIAAHNEICGYGVSTNSMPLYIVPPSSIDIALVGEMPSVRITYSIPLESYHHVCKLQNGTCEWMDEDEYPWKCYLCVNVTGFQSLQSQSLNVSISMSQNQTHIVVDVRNLQPVAVYQFFVRYQWGPERRTISQPVNCSTPMAAPLLSPVLQEAMRINSTCFFIVYKGIGLQTVRSPAFYYQLTIHRNQQQKPLLTIAPHPGNEIVNSTVCLNMDWTLPTLTPWTNYELTLQSCCDSTNCSQWASTAQCGQMTAEDLEAVCQQTCRCNSHVSSVIIQPHEIYFGAVANINVTTSSLWAIINWKPIADSFLVSYELNITSPTSQRIVNVQHPWAYVDQLQPKTNYSVIVSVSTYDRQLSVQPSSLFSFTTAGQNSAPRDVSVIGMPTPNANSVFVSWVPNLLPNIGITGYDIEFCHSACRTVQTNSISHNVTVDGLEPRTLYSFRVAARNEFGAENWSMPYLYTMQNFIVLRNISVQVQGSQTIQVTFSTPVYNSTSRQTCQYLNLSVCFAINSSCILHIESARLSSGKGSVIISQRLQSATRYYVRVLLACKELAVWSDPVYFNTSADSTSASHIATANSSQFSKVLIISLSCGSVIFFVIFVVLLLGCRYRTKIQRRQRPDRVSAVSNASTVALNEPYETVSDSDDVDEYTQLENDAVRLPEEAQTSSTNRVRNYSEGSVPFHSECGEERRKGSTSNGNKSNWWFSFTSGVRRLFRRSVMTEECNSETPMFDLHCHGNTSEQRHDLVGDSNSGMEEVQHIVCPPQLCTNMEGNADCLQERRFDSSYMRMTGIYMEDQSRRSKLHGQQFVTGNMAICSDSSQVNSLTRSEEDLDLFEEAVETTSLLAPHRPPALKRQHSHGLGRLCAVSKECVLSSGMLVSWKPQGPHVGDLATNSASVLSSVQVPSVDLDSNSSGTHCLTFGVDGKEGDKWCGEDTVRSAATATHLCPTSADKECSSRPDPLQQLQQSSLGQSFEWDSDEDLMAGEVAVSVNNSRERKSSSYADLQQLKVACAQGLDSIDRSAEPSEELVVNQRGSSDYMLPPASAVEVLNPVVKSLQQTCTSSMAKGTLSSANNEYSERHRKLAICTKDSSTRAGPYLQMDGSGTIQTYNSEKKCLPIVSNGTECLQSTVQPLESEDEDSESDVDMNQLRSRHDGNAPMNSQNLPTAISLDHFSQAQSSGQDSRTKAEDSVEMLQLGRTAACDGVSTESVMLSAHRAPYPTTPLQIEDDEYANHRTMVRSIHNEHDSVCLYDDMEHVENCAGKQSLIAAQLSLHEDSSDEDELPIADFFARLIPPPIHGIPSVDSAASACMGNAPRNVSTDTHADEPGEIPVCGTSADQGSL